MSTLSNIHQVSILFRLFSSECLQTSIRYNRERNRNTTKDYYSKDRPTGAHQGDLFHSISIYFLSRMILQSPDSATSHRRTPTISLHNFLNYVECVSQQIARCKALSLLIILRPLVAPWTCRLWKGLELQGWENMSRMFWCTWSDVHEISPNEDAGDLLFPHPKSSTPGNVRSSKLGMQPACCISKLNMRATLVRGELTTKLTILCPW